MRLLAMVGAIGCLVTVVAAPATANPSPGAASRYPSAVLADNPVAYYRLGEAPGATVMTNRVAPHGIGRYAPNDSGYTLGVDGAITGDTAVSDNGAPSGVGLGGADNLPSGNSPRTLEIFYRSTNPQRTALVDYGTFGHLRIIGLAVCSGDVLCVDYFGGTLRFAARHVVTDGNWHLLDLTWDGSNFTMYFDGHLLGTRAPDGPLDTPVGSKPRVGVWVDNQLNKPTVGDLDELAIYPTALTLAQVHRHYYVWQHQ